VDGKLPSMTVELMRITHELLPGGDDPGRPPQAAGAGDAPGRGAPVEG
jgi:hypothetical protein